MPYRSVLSNQELKKQTMSAIKGNRWRLFFGLALQLILTAGLSGAVIFVITRLHLLPVELLATLPSPLAFMLNFRVMMPMLIQAVSARLSGPMALGVFGMLFVLYFMWTHWWIYGLNHSFLEMVDTGKFRYRTVWRSFTQRPIRHFIAALIVMVISAILSSIYLMAMTAIGVFFYITILTVQSPTIAPWLGMAVVLLYIILAVLLLLLLILLLNWIGYGFQLFMYPSYDAKKTGMFRSFSISWRLMRGNKWQLFRLGLSYLIWPFVGAGILGLLYLLFGLMVPMEWALYVNIAIPVVLTIWFIMMLVRWSVARAVFYRDQTQQYARRLNEQYPNFNATPKAGLTTRFHTEQHPRFTDDTLAIELPQFDAPKRGEAPVSTGSVPSDSDSTKKKYRIKAGQAPKASSVKHYQVIKKASAPVVLPDGDHRPKESDPGYRLDEDNLEEPIAAADIFNGHDTNETKDK
ncbi:MAG: hypothetical protein Q4A55_04580 [Aerococcus sp.]|nr:hypothetical protein [Aerococcus sp.]